MWHILGSQGVLYVGDDVYDDIMMEKLKLQHILKEGAENMGI